MPLYEYECPSCSAVVEALVRNDSDDREQQASACPDCGQRSMQRVFSVPASPSVKASGGLPMAEGPCGAPKCCGGGCQLD